MTPANMITVTRLLFAPVLIVAVVEVGPNWGVFLLGAALGLTDALDGYIARRQQPSRFGAFLDPLADKVLILGAMFTLVSRGVFWVVPVVIIAAREFVISVYRVKVAGRGISVPASKLGKYKTLAQQLAVGFALLPWTALDSRWLWNGLLWVAVILAVVSGAQYLRRSRQPIPTNTVQPVA
jgi:CDP-diacylglycerol--glycerol-3-phosphate 3-phosphatidyltransferase